ncbi:hypothetical protein BHE97_09315 [Aeromicrobium sp. PE09-221]|uniref:hypothetical protein n=1 Tax=Aeromicrobium sp. PE09-221 TaxID=1898043 RepID=UPI000B3EBD53|nr:hypothetical protein [Aeromicrobium sp. PE09-221]OUZ09994.1 hypothetical protein BHE97_09315 [Aeromicrobium sp. PE09-221]
MRHTRPAVWGIIASCAAILVALLGATALTQSGAPTRSTSGATASVSTGDRTTTTSSATAPQATTADDHVPVVTDQLPLAVLTAVVLLAVTTTLLAHGQRGEGPRRRVRARAGRAPPAFC